MEFAKKREFMDRLAIVGSGFCLIHCLVTPALLIAIPVAASTAVGDAQFHRLLLGFVVPTSSLALLLGCRRHKDWIVLILGLVGLGQLVLNAFLGHELFGEVGEKAMTVASSLILIVAHVCNRRLCRRDGCQM
jgi:hypothetical protein